jgi:hypothetical protein
VTASSGGLDWQTMRAIAVHPGVAGSIHSREVRVRP